MKTEDAEKYRRMVRAVEIQKKLDKLIADLKEVGYEFISFNGKTGLKRLENGIE